MTKIAFSVNDRSGFLRAKLVPINLSQKTHLRLLGGIIGTLSVLGVVELIVLIAR